MWGDNNNNDDYRESSCVLMTEKNSQENKGNR